jgi:hypothetical protein
MVNGSPRRDKRGSRRLGSWLVGYPTTVILGTAYAAIIGFRWSVVGGAALFVVIVGVAAGERWGERATGPEAPEWLAFRLAYSALIVVGTVIFAVSTGIEFYFFSLPAVALVPAFSTIGRGLRARLERRTARPAG